MKTGCMLLLAVVLLGGCAKKELPPVTIRILGPAAVETDGIRQTHREQRDFLQARFNRHGASPVVLLADSNTTYAALVPARDAALSAGYWKFMLGMSDTTNREEFITHWGDGPPGVTVDVDAMTGRIMIEHAVTDATLFEIIGKETNRWFHVWISADATTTAAQLFGLLRTCKHAERAAAYIVNREDRIANQHIEHTEVP